MNPRRRRLAILLALVVPLVSGLTRAPARAQGNLALATRDGLDAWAVGDSGRYYRTLDGGVSWGFGNLGTRTLRAVAVRGLHVIIAGDSGRVWHSADAGGSWIPVAVPGAPTLRAIDMADDSTGYLVGDAGTVVRVTQSGAGLTPLPSGLGVRLDAVRFTDAQHGWVVGAGGLAAHTTDGGVSWTPIELATTRDLHGVDVAGAAVWIVGDDAGAWRALDGGMQFAPVPLGLDTRADIRAVHLATADTVWLAGGGGFLRVSTDGGTSWSWPVHPLQGPLGAIAFAGSGGFMCGTQHRVVAHSSDHGTTWALPADATVTRSWIPKLTFGNGVAQVRGNTLAMNPVYKTEFACMIGFTAGGVKLYRSLDEGESWAQLGPTLSSPSRASALMYSPRDSSVMLALVTDPGQVLKSTDAGLSWVPKLTRPYGEFGVPMTMNPDHPDTLFFAGDTSGVWRSLDGGESWAPWGSTVFREPCDIEVVPDSGHIVFLTDGASGLAYGELWRSTDAGASWSLRLTGTGQTSELPEIAVSRLRPATVFATAWRDGGTRRSTDWGATWSTVSVSQPPWGVAIAGDDPNLVVIGMYGGGQSYLSFDGGTSWSAVPLPAANYSFLARDRGTIVAEQSNGLYKLAVGYGFTPSNVQTLTLTSPLGGEVWNPRDVHTITWSSSQVAIVRLEYRTAPDQPWHRIEDVEGGLGQYEWTVPPTPGAQTEVRVSDAWDASPADSSAAAFTISTVDVADSAAPALRFDDARPNPFTTRTELQYELPRADHVRLELFDVRGARVAMLVDAWQPPGAHRVVVDGATFGGAGAAGRRPAGIYLARLRLGAQIVTRKLVRLR